MIIGDSVHPRVLVIFTALGGLWCWGKFLLYLSLFDRSLTHR